MYKKLIFAALTMLCSINLISSEESFNDKRKRLNYLFSIEKEINNTFLSEKEKQEVKAIIQNYSYTNQSYENYVFALKRLKNNLNVMKTSRNNYLITNIMGSFFIGFTTYIALNFLSNQTIISNPATTDVIVTQNNPLKEVINELQDIQKKYIYNKDDVNLENFEQKNKLFKEESIKCINKITSIIENIRPAINKSINNKSTASELNFRMHGIIETSVEIFSTPSSDPKYSEKNNSIGLIPSAVFNFNKLIYDLKGFNLCLEEAIQSCKNPAYFFFGFKNDQDLKDVALSNNLTQSSPGQGLLNNTNKDNQNCSSQIIVPTLLGLATFTFSTIYQQKIISKLNNIEKLLDQAIQKAELAF